MTRRAALRLSLLALGLSGRAFGQPAAAPIPPAFFAMTEIPPASYPKITAGTLAHPDFGWPQLELSRGVFRFSLLDAYVDSAQAYGLVEPFTNVASVVFTLGPTPAWAAPPGTTCSDGGCAAPPADLRDWTDFLSALLAHYDGVARPHLRWLVLWDAADADRWSGTEAQMLALAEAAWPIVHRDPHTRLLTPSFSGPIDSAAARMSSYLSSGGVRFADGGAFSGYVAQPLGGPSYPMPEDDSSWGSIVTRATRMRAVLDASGLAGRPLLQTEGGWGLRTIPDSSTQITWLARYLLLQAGLSSKLDLAAAAWYAWSDPSHGWGNIEDGHGNLTAAGRAYDRVYHWIVGATMAQPCSASGAVWSCALARPGGYTARAVWSTAGTATYAPGPGFIQMRDLAGKTTPITSGASVPIGPAPILLEGGPAAAAGAPNIVLVLTDDQDLMLGSMDAMPRVKELLADRGATFSNSLVPLSLCCPSRATSLRGQYPHNSGVLHNILPNGGFLRAYTDNIEASTLATQLQGAGYRTVLLGKYLNEYPLRGSETYVPPGWDEWYSPAAGTPYNEYDYSLNENGKLVFHGDTPDDYLTDVISRKAVDFIRRSAASLGTPIFVYFATYAPHGPYVPAPRHALLFPGVGAPRPPSFDQADVSAKPAYIAALPLLEPADISQIDQHYRMRLQSLQAVDEAVTAIVSALSDAGRLENTYIVFTSDNGYHMGEYRLSEGKYSPYATDIRVPLILRGPGIPPGVVREELAANLDLAPTFAEMAGVAPFEFSDGRSLKGVAAGNPPAAWRRAFLLEEFNTGVAHPGDSVATDPAPHDGVLEPPDPDDLRRATPPDITGIIPSYYGYQAPGYKYVEYQTKEKELYVASDVDDVTNVISRVDPSIAAKLAAHLRTLVGCKADGCRAAEDAEPPALLAASFTISPPDPSSGALVTLTASAVGTAPYQFTWGAGGATWSGPSVQIALPDGTWPIALTARDGIGAEATATKTVTVGTPPTVQIQSPAADLTVEAAVPVSFAAIGTPSAPGGTFAFTWDFGDGAPRATGSSVTRPFGTPGTYVVTLTGVDSRGAVATAARTVTVTRPELAGSSLLLPVVLEGPGAGGSFYSSEVTLASHLGAPVEVLLSYTASSGGGTGYARLTLLAGEQRILPGILGWLRTQGLAIPSAGSSRVGTLLATFGGEASASGLFFGARTFTADPAGGPGTFGLFNVATPAAGDTLTVSGLRQDASQRSNLGLVNTGASAVALRVTLLDGAGTTLSETDVGLPPFGWTQKTAPLAAAGASNGVAVVSRTSGVGGFTAYGVLNDQVTSDGSFVPALSRHAAGADRFLPIVLSTASYSSELTLTNLTQHPLPLVLSYTASPRLGSGAGTGSASLTLVPGEQRIAPDALAFLRQAGIDIPAGEGGGSLLIGVPDGGASDLGAGVRIFTRSGGGSYGVFAPATTLDEAAGSAAWVHALQQGPALRSNVAVANRGDAGDPITVRITYFGEDGSPAGPPDERSLAPGEWVQFDRPLESRGVGAGYARVEKLSGASRFVAYGVLNDQTTSDGSWVPMTR